MSFLQFVTCTKCNSSYMVGFMNKDVRETKLSGGTVEEIPYVAIGCDEIKDSPRINAGEIIPCPHCGKECVVEDSTEGKKHEN
jgi:hypothetical protein